MMANNIIVSRELNNDYLTLFRALSDKELRESLKRQAGLDRAFMDLMLMADDPAYVKMVNDVKAVAREQCCGAAVPVEVEKLREYASAKYPEGWDLIKEYETTTRNSASPKDVAVQVGPSIMPVIFFPGPIVTVYVT